MDEFNYPTLTQTIEPAKRLAPLLRGKIPDDYAQALKDAYTVQGYSMSLIVPVSPPIGALSQLQVADFLESLNDSAVVPQAVTIPWDLILGVIISFIEQWRKAHQSAPAVPAQQVP